MAPNQISYIDTDMDQEPADFPFIDELSPIGQPAAPAVAPLAEPEPLGQLADPIPDDDFIDLPPRRARNAASRAIVRAERRARDQDRDILEDLLVGMGIPPGDWYEDEEADSDDTATPRKRARSESNGWEGDSDNPIVLE